MRATSATATACWLHVLRCAGLAAAQSPQDLAASCGDDAAFTDDLGWACDSWVGYDCFDVQTALSWGYTADGMDAIVASCQYSCGLCGDAPAPPEVAVVDSWSGIPQHGASPPPLREMTLLARSVGGLVNEVALWGGTTGTTLNGELYLLRTDTFVWRREPITSGTRPAARSQHGSTMQSGHQMVIVGGADSSHFMRNDVWRIDLNERYKSWQQLSPDGAAGAMSRRIAPGVAVLNDTHLLVSGGSSAAEYGIPDLWLFDTRSGQQLQQQQRNGDDMWKLLHTWEPGETGPRACYLPLLVVDSDSSGVRSVWGTNGNNKFGASLSDLDQTQTWRFDLINEEWSRMPALGEPPPDLWAPLTTTYMDADGIPHVIGGFGWSSSDGYVDPSESMYRLSPDGIWTHLLPPSNSSMAGCVDNVDFLDEFGDTCSAWSGYNCSDRQQAEDWGYSSSTVDEVMAACPFTCGLCISTASSSDTSMSFKPLGRSNGGFVALSETEFLTFGGWGASSMLNDLILFRTTDVGFLSIANQSVSPNARKGASVVAIGTQSFMFGGESDDGERLEDLWSLTPVDGWQVVHVIGKTPGRRSYHASGSSGRKFCVHGGQHANGYLLQDMWCLDIFTLRWDEISASHVPPARKGHTLVAVADSKWVLFGGTGADGTLDDATWQIDLQTDNRWWRLDCTSQSVVAPSARRWHGAARVHINGTDFMALVGGENRAAEEQADMWLLEHNDFQIMEEDDNAAKSSASSICRRDDGKQLRTTWHLVENYVEALSPCSTWSNCDYYAAGRSRFVLAGSQANVLILAGGVTDYGAMPLADVVHVVFTKSDDGYRIHPRWVTLDGEFGGSRVHSAGACVASDIVLFAGASRIWQSTELSLTSNEAFRLSFPPCESEVSAEESMVCVPCSPGFVADNSSGSGICVPCPIGTYSRFDGDANHCVDCPLGYEGVMEAASSPDQCSPCPAFTHYERLVGCVPCSGSERCPIATIEPEPLQNFTGVVSKQPKILLSREQRVWAAQKVVYLATLIVLLAIVTSFAFNMLLKPHNDRVRSFDLLFSNAHAAGFYSAKVGFHSQKKKTAVGGWFTLLTGVSALAYVIVLIMPLVLNNTEETQSLQPNLVWASTETEHMADFEIRVNLKGYRGQCTADLVPSACSEGITVSSDSPQFRSMAAARCELRGNGHCTLIWSCEKCVVEGVVTLTVAFQESFAFTHEISWSVASDSSFADGSGPDDKAQKSSLSSTVQPSSPERSFRGLRPTEVRLIARPSMYTFQTTAEKEVGYHLEYLSTTRGSEVTESSFNNANGVKIRFAIEQAPSTLSTVRVVHQSIFVFLSNSSAAIMGLLGVFSYLLGHVEAWYYKSRPFESLDRADIMVADWMRSGAPRIFEQLNKKYFKNNTDEQHFLAVRARCLQSDIFQVFDRFDTQRKGFLSRREFQDFMNELDITLTESDRTQVEEFFEDGRVTFNEFKEFYLDHTQRTQQQRRRAVTARLESTPRARAAKEKWQSKVQTLNAVRMLGRNSAQSAKPAGADIAIEHQQQGQEQEQEAKEVEKDRRTIVKLTGTKVRKDGKGKEFTVFVIECKRHDGTMVYPEPKRFSEFFALRSALIKAGRHGIEKIDFPARKVRRSSSSSQSTVENRLTVLEAWLNEVLYKYANDPALIDFVATRSKSFWNLLPADGDAEEEGIEEQKPQMHEQPVRSSGAAPQRLLLTLRASMQDNAGEQDGKSIGAPEVSATTEGTPSLRPQATTSAPRSTTPPPRCRP